MFWCVILVTNAKHVSTSEQILNEIIPCSYCVFMYVSEMFTLHHENMINKYVPTLTCTLLSTIELMFYQPIYFFVTSFFYFLFYFCFVDKRWSFLFFKGPRETIIIYPYIQYSSTHESMCYRPISIIFSCIYFFSYI